MTYLKIVLVVISFIGLFGAAEVAEAGPFRHARKNRSAEANQDSGYPTIVAPLPPEGATRQLDGWNWEFRRTGPNSGTWYGTHPVGENASDYYQGYPKDGLIRYEDGLRWTYDRSTNKWSSGWYRVR